MTATRPHVVLASGEVWPYMTGGGIGRHVHELALTLAAHADVTILTRASARELHEGRVRRQDPHVPEGVRFAFFETPDPIAPPLWSPHHASSLACAQALREIAREHPVDLVEFEDYEGLAAVALDARRAGDPELRETTIAVRLHASWEILAGIDRQRRELLGGRTVIALERLGLRFADVLLAATASTLEAYTRFYGDAALAPSAQVPPALLLPAATSGAPEAGGPLRLLHVGRLQELKGVDALVRAVLALPERAATLTLVGGDTATSPGGGSMRAYLERVAGGDGRVRFLDELDRAELPAVYAAHHAVVVASRFESYGYVAREALAANRPVLVTPVGGLVDAVMRPGAGWTTRDSSNAGIAEGVEELVKRREEIERLIGAGAPRAAVEDEARNNPIAERYLDLCARGTRRRHRAEAVQGDAAVTAVVSAEGGDLEATLGALEAQELPALEIVVVARDTEHVPPRTLPRLHRLVLSLDGAPTLDAALADAVAGRRLQGHVLFLHAGDVLDVGTLARCVRGLAAAPDLAYVTTHGAGDSPTDAPLGNAVAALIDEHDAAATMPLVRVDALAHGLPRDAQPGCAVRSLLGELAAEGSFGAVLPEPLVRIAEPPACLTSPVASGLAALGPPREIWEASALKRDAARPRA